MRGYTVELFREDGTPKINTSFMWGYKAHKWARNQGAEFVWYTVSKLENQKVLSEFEWQSPRHRNQDGYWLDVTHAPIYMGGYWYCPMRPDELARFLANPPKMR